MSFAEAAEKLTRRAILWFAGLKPSLIAKLRRTAKDITERKSVERLEEMRKGNSFSAISPEPVSDLMDEETFRELSQARGEAPDGRVASARECLIKLEKK